MTEPNKPLDIFFNQNDIVLSGTTFQKFDFTRTMDANLVINDHDVAEIFMSFDGKTKHMVLKPSESSLSDLRRRNKVYLKIGDSDVGTFSGIPYRVAAWMTG